MKVQKCMNMKTTELTPVIKRGNHYYKCEDEFVVNGVCGGKARVVMSLVQEGIMNNKKDFVTCGSRDSRQCEVVGRICEYYGVKSHLFMPSGKDTDISTSLSNTKGATIHRTKVGYNNVLIHDSYAYAKDNDFYYIPFGLECQQTIDINMHQVQNIPDDVKRIIVPCGGGMNMLAIIKGLEYYKKADKEVIGVVVGKKPNIFAKYLPNDMFDNIHVKYSFMYYPFDYHTKPKERMVDGIELDEVYEAKCIPFLQDGDLMWIVGRKIN